MEDANAEKERRYISSLPEFAEIFLFLQIFGPLINLPTVTLKSLEDFFVNDDWFSEDVATVQWRLIRWAGKSGPKEEWQRMAVKFGVKMGVVTAATAYADMDVHTRMKIFQRSCEEQFDCNLTLRSNMNWDEPAYRQTNALGVDREGRRYWVLQDAAYSVHLYRDRGYADPPTGKSYETWELLASTLEGLSDTICALDSRGAQVLHQFATTLSESQDLQDDDTSSTDGISKNKRKSSREKGMSKSGEKKIIGCLKCHKDVDYKKMLLCDSCDRECHTYCQYPVLWNVPKGKWQCPICEEQQLLKELQQVYQSLCQAKAQHEQFVERKQRSVARLQRSGVLAQNILDDGAEEGRSRRRNRKEINYAELNDFYLPPLRSTELVGGKERRALAHQDKTRNMFDYIQEDYLAPRVRSSNRRRLKEASPELDVVLEQEEGEVEKEAGLEREAGGQVSSQYVEEDVDNQVVQEEREDLSEKQVESDPDEKVERNFDPLSDMCSIHLSKVPAQPPISGPILGKRSFDHPNPDANATARLLSANTNAFPHAVSNGSPVDKDALGKATCEEREDSQIDTWRVPVEGHRDIPADAPMALWTEKEAFEQLPQQFLQDPGQLAASCMEQSVTEAKESHSRPEVTVDKDYMT